MDDEEIEILRELKTCSKCQLMRTDPPEYWGYFAIFVPEGDAPKLIKSWITEILLEEGFAARQNNGREMFITEKGIEFLRQLETAGQG